MFWFLHVSSRDSLTESEEGQSLRTQHCNVLSPVVMSGCVTLATPKHHSTFSSLTPLTSPGIGCQSRSGPLSKIPGFYAHTQCTNLAWPPELYHSTFFSKTQLTGSWRIKPGGQTRWTVELWGPVSSFGLIVVFALGTGRTIWVSTAYFNDRWRRDLSSTGVLHAIEAAALSSLARRPNYSVTIYWLIYVGRLYSVQY